MPGLPSGTVVFKVLCLLHYSEHLQTYVQGETRAGKPHLLYGFI